MQHHAEAQPPDLAEIAGESRERDDAHRLPHGRGIALDILEGIGVQLQCPYDAVTKGHAASSAGRTNPAPQFTPGIRADLRARAREWHFACCSPTEATWGDLMWPPTDDTAIQDPQAQGTVSRLTVRRSFYLPGDFVPRTPLHRRSRGPLSPAPLRWLVRCAHSRSRGTRFAADSRDRGHVRSARAIRTAARLAGPPVRGLRDHGPRPANREPAAL